MAEQREEMMNEYERLGDLLKAMEPQVNRATLLDVAANGILYEEERARAGPCKCFEYEIRGEKRSYCWAPGIIGGLSKSQIEEYCPPEKRVAVEKKPERFQKFLEASEECKGLDLKGRLECMSKALERKGVPL